MGCRFLIGSRRVFRCDCSSRAIDTMNVPAPHKEKQMTTIASFSIRFTGELQFGRLNSIRMLRQTAEISKAINPGAMSIGPAELQCIAADKVESEKLKALVGMAYIRTHNMTEHIRFAAARCARACAPHQFEFYKRFGAIVPGNGQFVPDLLDVRWFKSHFSNSLSTSAFLTDEAQSRNRSSLLCARRKSPYPRAPALRLPR